MNKFFLTNNKLKFSNNKINFYNNNNISIKRFSAKKNTKTKQAYQQQQTTTPAKKKEEIPKQDILSNPIKGKEEKIFLFNHETAKRYYKLNVLPLLGYLAVSGATVANPEYPDYLKKTMYFFMSVSFITLVGISFYAKRHIHSMSLVKPSNFLLVETFSKVGFGKDRLYQVPLKEIEELVPLSNYIGTSQTGVYIVKLSQNTKYHKLFNFFFIRPKSGIYFDQIFKGKVRK